MSLDRFTQAYIECALWAETDNADESGGQPLDHNYDSDDISPATITRMAEDCADFQSEHAALLRESGLSDEQAGYDFWLTRNGYGAGFWDRGLGAVGDKLTAACKAYGSFDLYVGDDGQLHGS